MDFYKAADDENEDIIRAVIYEDEQTQYKVLTYATSQEKVKTVQVLLKEGCKVNIQGETSNTPLHIAILKNNAKLVKMLLDGGALVKIPNVGETLLHYAMENKNKIIVEMIASKWVQEDNHGGILKLPLLFFACLNDDSIAVERFLRYGTEVNTNITDWLGYTYLHVAVKYENIETVKVLLKHGADANMENDRGLTPLQLAVLMNNAAIVDLILSFRKSINVNDKYSDGNTLLILAAKHKFKRIVYLLLERGALVDIQNSEGLTALHYAVASGSFRISKAILSAYCGKCRSKNGVTRFARLTASRREITALVNSEYESKTLLEIALHSFQSAPIMKLLLNHGAERKIVTRRGRTLLHLAAESDREKVIKVLLFERNSCNEIEYPDGEKFNEIDVNRKDSSGETPFHVIAKTWNTRGLQMLLDLGGDVARLNSNNLTPLLITASKDHIYQLDYMIEADRSCYDKVNPTDENGLSHFHLACLRDDLEIVNTYLNNGVDIKSHVSGQSIRYKGYTALHFAAKSNNVRVAELLINRGAEVDVKLSECPEGVTPLYVAAYNGAFGVMKLLLESGADFCASDNEGNDILHLLVRRNNIFSQTTDSFDDIIDLVLEYHGDLNKLLELAMKTCRKAFDVQILLNRGAEIDFSKFFEQGYCQECYKGPESRSICELYETVRWHILQSQVMGVHLSENNLEWFTPDFGPFWYNGDVHHKKIVSSELKRLKDVSENSAVTLDEFILKDAEMRKYVGLEDLEKIVEARDFVKKYPWFGRRIKRNFRRAAIRREIINLAELALESITKLPNLCCHEIVKFLPNEKLKTLIRLSGISQSDDTSF